VGVVELTAGMAEADVPRLAALTAEVGRTVRIEGIAARTAHRHAEDEIGILFSSP
jgi:hypothetical protein